MAYKYKYKGVGGIVKWLSALRDLMPSINKNFADEILMLPRLMVTADALLPKLDPSILASAEQVLQKDTKILRALLIILVRPIASLNIFI